MCFPYLYERAERGFDEELTEEMVEYLYAQHVGVRRYESCSMFRAMWLVDPCYQCHVLLFWLLGGLLDVL